MTLWTYTTLTDVTQVFGMAPDRAGGWGYLESGSSSVHSSRLRCRKLLPRWKSRQLGAPSALAAQSICHATGRSILRALGT